MPFLFFPHPRTQPWNALPSFLFLFFKQFTVVYPLCTPGSDILDALPYVTLLYGHLFIQIFFFYSSEYLNFSYLHE